VHRLALSSATLLALWLCACGAGIPADARTTVLSMQKLDCGECGDELAEKLRSSEGVYEARFDKRTAEVTIKAAPGMDVLASAKRLAGDEEYTLVAGAGRGSYLEWATPPPGADVAVVAKDGADVPDLVAHLASGKVTVMDFGAPWCEPCRKVDEHMLAVVGARQDVAYRKLDVGDWDTPLAARYLKGIPSLPYVIVYGKQGTKIEAIVDADIDRFLARLDAAIDAGAR
jgi:thiol-disulfide isomerase/thioredoxin